MQRDLEALIGSDVGPANCQPHGHGAGLEPEVGRGPNPLDEVDRLDLVRLRQQHPELAGAEPCDTIGGPGVAAYRRGDGQHQAIGRILPEAVDEPLEPVQLGQHDRGGPAVANGPRGLRVDRG